MLELIVDFLLLILQMVTEVLFVLTGYAILFVFSLGRVRPEAKDEWLATIVGLVFWASIVALLCFWNRA